MIVHIFTIREKETNKLIYAEGTSAYDEYCSHFKINKKWLKDDEINESWLKLRDNYSFTEEVRFLTDAEYSLVKFSIEEIEIK